MIPLGPAETDIGAAFRQTNAADQLAIGIPHRDAGIAQDDVGTGPDISRPVHPHAVGMAINPIHHAFGEAAQAGDFAARDIADMDAAADDVDALIVRRKTDAIGA